MTVRGASREQIAQIWDSIAGRRAVDYAVSGLKGDREAMNAALQSAQTMRDSDALGGGAPRGIIPPWDLVRRVPIDKDYDWGPWA